MSKLFELVMISVLLVSVFFFGVAYSGPVKENFSWLFEVKEQEVEILDIKKKHDIAKTVKIKNDINKPDDVQKVEDQAPESFDE